MRPSRTGQPSDAGDRKYLSLRHDNARPAATIFGAGITGLTVAHELVERGFRVQVWECAQDERRPDRGCDVGGMARTQWGGVDWPQEVTRPPARMADNYPGQQVQPITHIEERFAWRQGTENEGLYGYDADGEVATDLKDVVQALLAQICAEHGRTVYAEVVHSKPSEDADKTSPFPWTPALEALRKALSEVGGNPIQKPVPNARSRAPQAIDSIELSFEGKEATLLVVPIEVPKLLSEGDGTSVWIGFRVRQRWLPGEHGYRFFPAFYHHLFDTMKRTPVLEPIEKSEYAVAQESVTHDAPAPFRYVETGRTAFDSLIPASQQVLAANGRQRSATLPRYLVPTLEGLRLALEDLLRPSHGFTGAGTTGTGPNGFGLYPRDIARFTVRLFAFLTSCRGRRDDLSEIDWRSLLGDDISDELNTLLEQLPRSLVAMTSSEIDAHSYALIASQLLLDQFKPTGFRDGVLNGPTSEAWLSHWRRYLEAQGVEFIYGRLEDLEILELEDQRGKPAARLQPITRCYDPRYGDAENAPLLDGYWVVALPTLEAQRIARSVVEANQKSNVKLAPATLRDVQALAAWNLGPSDNLRCGVPTATAFRNMCGIQFFFEDDVHWVNGHVLYLNSKFGLTSVSQARFWQDKSDWEHGYRGVLSVIITCWSEYAPSTEAGQPKKKEDPWKFSPERLATEIWKEIQDALFAEPPPGHTSTRLSGYGIPNPVYYHLDQNIRQTYGVEEQDGTGRQSKDRLGTGYSNETPFLINRPGEWQGRPGALGPNESYSICDRLVLAGIYMKTHTRVNCMETANESGRHAVNAILDDLEARREGYLARCDIWPLDEREVTDLRLLRELDERLHKDGYPHFLDILEVDRTVSEWTPGQSSVLDEIINPILSALR